MPVIARNEAICSYKYEDVQVQIMKQVLLKDKRVQVQSSDCFVPRNDDGSATENEMIGEDDRSDTSTSE